MEDRNKKSGPRESKIDRSSRPERRGKGPAGNKAHSDKTERNSPPREPKHKNTRVWRHDRPMFQPDTPEEQNESKRGSRPSSENERRDKSEKRQGKKLWLKSKGTRLIKADKPPAGFEKHKDLEHYVADEMEERAERFRKARKAEKKNKPPREIKKPEQTMAGGMPTFLTPAVEEDPIKELFTISIGRQSMQKFIQRLVDAGIGQVIDLRSDEAMLRPGFTKSRDLAILLKEAAGIEYRRDEVLIPRRDLLIQYQRDKNWKRFYGSYFKQLSRQKADVVLPREQFVKFKFALIGDSSNINQDQCLVAAEYLKERWNVEKIINL